MPSLCWRARGWSHLSRRAILLSRSFYVSVYASVCMYRDIERMGEETWQVLKWCGGALRLIRYGGGLGQIGSRSVGCNTVWRWVTSDTQVLDRCSSPTRPRARQARARLSSSSPLKPLTCSSSRMLVCVGVGVGVGVGGWMDRRKRGERAQGLNVSVFLSHSSVCLCLCAFVILFFLMCGRNEGPQAPRDGS
jgi:hypothetical protein